MTNEQFQRAFEIAKTGDDLHHADPQPFDGFALPDFEPVVVTFDQVARLIRWQAAQFNGGWDSEALTEIRNIGRHKFTVV